MVTDKDISNIEFALLTQSESLGMSLVPAAATSFFLRDNFTKKQFVMNIFHIIDEYVHAKLIKIP